MKKILLCLSILLLLLSGCASKEEVSYDYKISGSEVIEMMENKETFAVYIGTTSCSACASFKPIVEEMNKKYNTKIYHIDIDLEDEATAQSILEYFPVEYTPSTHLVVEGETVDIYEGMQDFLTLKKFLEDNGFVEKD